MERQAASTALDELDQIFATLPFGRPGEPLPGKEALGFRVPLYGFDRWSALFTPRQLLALGVFVKQVRASLNAMHAADYPQDWRTAITGYLYAVISRLADRNSELCTWQTGAEKIGHTFARFALPITWDFVEVMPWADSSGGFQQAVEWVSRVVAHLTRATQSAPASLVVLLRPRRGDVAPPAH